MNRNIDLILSGKGGVGKSFFAVHFVQFLQQENFPFTAFDSDNENSTLKRFHPAAEFIDIAEPRQLDSIFLRLEKTPLIVADCRAASTSTFFDFFREIELAETLQRFKTTLTVVIPISNEPDSIVQFQHIADELGGLARYVVLRNRALSETFSLFERAGFREALCKNHHVAELTMNRLAPWLVEALNEKNLTIAQAVKSSRLNLLDRQRLLTWQRVFHAEITRAGDLLLPDKPEKKNVHRTPDPTAASGNAQANGPSKHAGGEEPDGKATAIGRSSDRRPATGGLPVHQTESGGHPPSTRG